MPESEAILRQRNNVKDRQMALNLATHNYSGARAELIEMLRDQPPAPPPPHTEDGSQCVWVPVHRSSGGFTGMWESCICHATRTTTY